MTTRDDAPALPWWRFKMVWLVVGGPAFVVVAAIGTAVVAFRGADPVVETPAVRAADSAEMSTAPAMQARNHAATAAVR